MDDFSSWATGATAPLFRSALLLTGDWHRAEDLVQDTFARMYARWSALAVDNPTGYAQTTLVRVFLSQRRLRRNSERPVADLPERVAAAGDPALRQTLLAALRTLTPRDRAVVVLRYLADRSVDEVASDLGRSPSAVRVQSMRALARLRDLLGADLLDLVNQ